MFGKCKKWIQQNNFKGIFAKHKEWFHDFKRRCVTLGEVVLLFGFLGKVEILCQPGGGGLTLHVFFSKTHPWGRRYSARINTSNVRNTWAPVNPIIKGTSCAG